jgi:aspartyl-tRNA synthetase
MSFVTQEDVFAAIEPVLHGVFEEFADGKASAAPFPRIAYRDAMLRYGSDKPDLRNPIEIVDVSDQFVGSGLRPVRADGRGRQCRACDPGAGRGRPQPQILRRHERMGARPGLCRPWLYQHQGWRARRPDRQESWRGSDRQADRVARPRPERRRVFAAGKKGQAAKLAGIARTRIGEELGLIEQGVFKFCWVVDFPMYEYDEDTKRVDFSHNPFSMPQGELEALETMDPLDILAYQYDIVCNGVELSSGAIRNHKLEVMYKAFEIAGYTKEQVEENFAGMINAFKYGAPPHGGSAPGIDRIVMLLADEPNIREVVLFPMNQKAEDLMMGAPSPVSLKQLRELNIRVVEPQKAS